MSPTTSALEHARAGFRRAAKALDPERHDGPVSPALIDAWLCVQTVRTHPKWLAAASAAVQPIASGAPVPAAHVAPMLEACARGWVQQAIGPFRRAAERLLPHLPEHPTAAPALFGWWRMTGDAAIRARALALLDHPEASAHALRLGWHATADPALHARALSALSAPALPLRDWPVAADLEDRGPDSFAAELARWADSPPPPVEVIPAAAALALPPLHLRVDWFLADELAEGPMAEAATFPWPALRLRFARLTTRDQIHFVGRLGDAEPEELEDVGVVAPWIESLVAPADRAPLLDGAPARTRSRGGLRR